MNSNQIYVNTEESNKVEIIDKKKTMENNLSEFFDKNIISVHYKDNYANSIPIGAFGFGMTFLVFGFHLANLYPFDAVVLTQLLIFGGIGQITTGFMEFIKGRTFTASFYFIFGMYSITTFGLYFFDPFKLVADKSKDDMAAYYLLWIIIAFGFIFCSFKSNLMFTINIGLLVIMFLLECIGESQKSSKTIKAGGIFGIMAGFVSLYIGFGQLANESFNKKIFPMFPYINNNGIDKLEHKLE
jgi:succinate-acetate transporter protein